MGAQHTAVTCNKISTEIHYDTIHRIFNLITCNIFKISIINFSPHFQMAWSSCVCVCVSAAGMVQRWLTTPYTHCTIALTSLSFPFIPKRLLLTLCIYWNIIGVGNWTVISLAMCRLILQNRLSWMIMTYDVVPAHLWQQYVRGGCGIIKHIREWPFLFWADTRIHLSDIRHYTAIVSSQQPPPPPAPPHWIYLHI